MTKITLTFDNGPDPDVTPMVLDTLRDHGIKATFFVLGEKLRDRLKLTERSHAEGHWIGNHTYNHLVPLGAMPERGLAADEILRTQELIGDLSHARRLFRPFGGGGLLDRRLLNGEALEQLSRGGYTCVLWNVVPQDWLYPESWIERALSLCFAREHALLVLHDLPTGAMSRLGRFLDLARSRGAIFKQDFPPDCVPIERGRIVGPIDDYVTDRFSAPRLSGDTLRSPQG
jgi:peptidoglycan/xylan/chitin deacetylase (PgdA/CDA1 family)